MGPRCRDIARGSLLGGGLLEAATGIVHSLAERTGESVVLATLAHGRRYPLIRADGHAVIRVSPSFEGTDLFFETVTGRVLAAYALPAEREAILSVQGWPDARWEGIAGEAALQNALAPIRARGIAEDLSSKTGVFSLAAPVLDSRERLVAALGIYLPASRATEEHLAHIRTELAAAAARITSGISD